MGRENSSDKARNVIFKACDEHGNRDFRQGTIHAELGQQGAPVPRQSKWSVRCIAANMIGSKSLGIIRADLSTARPEVMFRDLEPGVG